MLAPGGRSFVVRRREAGAFVEPEAGAEETTGALGADSAPVEAASVRPARRRRAGSRGRGRLCQFHGRTGRPALRKGGLEEGQFLLGVGFGPRFQGRNLGGQSLDIPGQVAAAHRSRLGSAKVGAGRFEIPSQLVALPLQPTDTRGIGSTLDGGNLGHLEARGGDPDGRQLAEFLGHLLVFPTQLLGGRLLLGKFGAQRREIAAGLGGSGTSGTARGREFLAERFEIGAQRIRLLLALAGQLIVLGLELLPFGAQIVGLSLLLGKLGASRGQLLLQLQGLPRLFEDPPVLGGLPFQARLEDFVLLDEKQDALLRLGKLGRVQGGRSGTEGFLQACLEGAPLVLETLAGPFQLRLGQARRLERLPGQSQIERQLRGVVPDLIRLRRGLGGARLGSSLGRFGSRQACFGQLSPFPRRGEVGWCGCTRGHLHGEDRRQGRRHAPRLLGLGGTGPGRCGRGGNMGHRRSGRVRRVASGAHLGAEILEPVLNDFAVPSGVLPGERLQIPPGGSETVEGRARLSSLFQGLALLHQTVNPKELGIQVLVRPNRRPRCEQVQGEPAERQNAALHPKHASSRMRRLATGERRPAGGELAAGRHRASLAAGLLPGPNSGLRSSS
jgi:hypothetical protein